MSAQTILKKRPYEVGGGEAKKSSEIIKSVGVTGFEPVTSTLSR